IVDLDDEETARVGDLVFQKQPTLKVKTSRGIHLYYRKPKSVFIKNWTNKLTSCGVEVDYKLGNKSLGVVKQNGQMRPMENDHLLGKWDQLPMLPLEFYPSKLKQSLLGLKDGQGRNSFLYTHLLAIREMYQDVTKEQITNLARFIAKQVFAEQ